MNIAEFAGMDYSSGSAEGPSVLANEICLHEEVSGRDLEQIGHAVAMA